MYENVIRAGYHVLADASCKAVYIERRLPSLDVEGADQMRKTWKLQRTNCSRIGLL
jgi:hypothetical protein